MGMSEFAKHVIAVANNNSNGISNLQLQKIMYFAIKDYLTQNGLKAKAKIETFYNEPFETWDYGPVVPGVYYQYKYYGNMLITDSGTYEPAFQDFDESIKNNLKVNVFDLVKKSHQQPLWRNHKEEILNHEHTYKYRLNDIMED